MAVTDQQKLDFLLKKIGYTKTKTGSVVGTGAISGTPKQPFAEAIPSPLIIANGALWNESDSIPTTPPGSDTAQVKVYLAASSGLRMTADSTSSGQRAFIAYSTYNNTSSTRLTNWIDTQFGSAYLIKVYKGDPNSGGVALSAAGSGQNDGWFFDYSAGVLNFNDTSVPSGVTDTNIYIVGYRYIGLTGAPTPTGGGNFTFNDLVVSRNFSVGGLSTFTGNIDANGIIEGIAGENKIPSLYANLGALPSATTYHGMFAHVHSTGRGYFAHAGNWLELVNKETNGVVGTGTEAYNIGNINAVDGVFSGNVSIGGTLTYEDVKNVDAVGLITARSGIRVTGGVIEALAGENKIPSLYANMGALPSAGSYHGMFAHVHATGRGYFAHAGNWLELVNKETNGTVGTGTETYNIGSLTATAIDLNGDIDVDGHTNLDNVSITGVTTFTGNISGIATFQDIDVDGHTNLDNVSIAGVSTFNDDVRFVGAAGTVFFDKSQNALEFTDDTQLRFGSDDTLKIYHDSSDNNTYIRNQQSSSHFYIQSWGTNKELFLQAKGNAEIWSGTTEKAIVARQGGRVELYNDNTKILQTEQHGIKIFGSINSTTGVSTFAGDIDLNSNLDVDGQTDLDILNVSETATFASDLDVDGHTNLDNVSIAGVTSVASLTSGRVVTVGTGGKLEDSANLTFNGNDLFVRGINIIGGGATSVLGADIVTRNFKATGVSTFVGDVQFDSGIKAGGSTGNNGEYLQSTGSGLTWSSFPSLRTRQTFTASSGQTTFSFAYTIGFLDVYVNGIKLTDAEFTATNGTTTVLAVGCFVGDIVELVAYNTVSASGGAFGIGNLVEDLSPQLGGNLDLNNKLIIGTGGVNITGVITATSFSGTVPSSSLSGALPALDGSALTGITASGSGVIIKHDGNTVGTAGTINFSTNLDVSPISAGIVTITASGGGGGGVSGINTIGGVVNIANDLDVDGHTNLDNVSIAGVTTVANNTEFIFGTNSTNTDRPLKIKHQTSNTRNQLTGRYIDFNVADARFKNIDNGNHIAQFFHSKVALFDNGNQKLETTGSGIDVTGNVLCDGLIVDGNSDFNGDLDVDGHTNLDNVSIAGVTTFTGAINVSDIRSDSITLKNAAGGSSYATFTNSDGKAVLNWNNTKRLETDVNGVNIVGILSATILAGDGSGITNLPVGGHYVQDEGNVLSAAPATVVNYVGAGVSATQSGSIATITIPGATGNMAFTKIAVAGQSDVDADSSTDTLTLVGGSNMTITTNASNDTITFQAAGGGGGSGVDVGITTNLTGSFTAAGSAATINTYAYSSIDRVFEYTVLIEQGSSFQTSKVLAKRSGTTINAVQYAVMHNSNLLAQLDVIISSGEVRLMATPEPGVTGTTGYRIKREVM